MRGATGHMVKVTAKVEVESRGGGRGKVGWTGTGLAVKKGCGSRTGRGKKNAGTPTCDYVSSDHLPGVALSGYTRAACSKNVASGHWASRLSFSGKGQVLHAHCAHDRVEPAPTGDYLCCPTAMSLSTSRVLILLGYGPGAGLGQLRTLPWSSHLTGFFSRTTDSICIGGSLSLYKADFPPISNVFRPIFLVPHIVTSDRPPLIPSSIHELHHRLIAALLAADKSRFGASLPTSKTQRYHLFVLDLSPARYRG